MQIWFFGVGNILLHSEAAHGNAYSKILEHVVWNMMGITSQALNIFCCICDIVLWGEALNAWHRTSSLLVVCSSHIQQRSEELEERKNGNSVAREVS